MAKRSATVQLSADSPEDVSQEEVSGVTGRATPPVHPPTPSLRRRGTFKSPRRRR